MYNIPKLTAILMFFIAITGCQNSLKLAETPDDVYYSPARGFIDGGDLKEKEYDYGSRTSKMMRYDYRWRSFYDEYDYRYDPYRFGYHHGYYYNPYYYPYPVYQSNPKTFVPRNSTPRMTNLSSYSQPRITTISPKTKIGTTTIPQFNNSNERSERRIITPRNNDDFGDNNTRTYAPATDRNTNTNSGNNGNGNTITRPSRGN
jgi:hypothetical protein